MNEIKSCMMCKSEKVKLTYLENARYRVECPDCGQYLEFNAPSEMAARVLWNRTFRNDCEDRWIPVSERIPEKNGAFIATQHSHSLKDYTKVLRTDVIEADFSNGAWKRAKHLEIIAWKPLPEAYKEDSK